MRDRLRAARDAAAELADKAQRLRPGGASDQPETVEDDDEVDEDLPDVEVTDRDHDELGHLDHDDEDCAPIAVETDDHSFFDLLRKIDPTPAVPLTEKHEVGLVALLRRLGELADTGLLEDRRTRRVLDLVGDRLSISAGPDGITVRSLLRRRHTPWKRVQRISIESRYDFVRGGGMTKLLEGLRSPFPIPGLGWLLRRITKGIAVWLERRFLSEESTAGLRHNSGLLLTGVKRRGRDIEFEGPLLMVSLLAPGLAEAVEQEARARGIDIDVAGQ
jgi:Bacterial PH domain